MSQDLVLYIFHDYTTSVSLLFWTCVCVGVEDKVCIWKILLEY